MKILLLLITCLLSLPAVAVEVAPRISDREIIESLAELKAGQRALEEKMDLRFTAVDQRFAAFDQRFAALEKQIDQRFDFLQQLILVLIAGIFGLIGFVVWDRFSTLRPMDARLRRIEQDLEHDLELQSPEGSKLTRMIHTLRELAKEDKRVEAILRSFSLL
jgi:hypothetical protein